MQSIHTNYASGNSNQTDQRNLPKQINYNMASAAVQSSNGPTSSSNSCSSRKRARDSLSSSPSIEIPQILVTLPKPQCGSVESEEKPLASSHYFEGASSYKGFNPQLHSQPKSEAESRVEHMVSSVVQFYKDQPLWHGRSICYRM